MPQKIRDKQIHVFVTERERDTIKRHAARYGMGVGEFIRQALIHTNALTVNVIDTKPLNDICYELTKQGTNLNQLMRFLNTYGLDAFNEKQVVHVMRHLQEIYEQTEDALISLQIEARRHKVIISLEMEEES